ncbi:response regulator transcription factor [Mollicutes bacterium LVI A0039]|nr:response regulator transcription factor [Mollicutes bacterium LVI A0039]
MKKILIVEDDKDIIGLLSFALNSRGFETIEAGDGRQGLKQFTNNPVDLIITDAMMPNVDGYEFVREVRKFNKTVPIIMLTALKAENNELEGFEVGVNDYVSKPFSIEILIKRIESQLNKCHHQPESLEDRIVDGNLLIDLSRYSIYVNDVEVKLTKKEFILLVELIENHGKVITRERLITLLWGENYFGDTRNIDTHIKNLRRKIENDRIKTIKGIGYMYEKTN